MFMTTMILPNPIIKRGDVALVLFPNTDLISAKTRPVLIVQADELETGLSQIIVAMIRLVAKCFEQDTLVV